MERQNTHPRQREVVQPAIKLILRFALTIISVGYSAIAWAGERRPVDLDLSQCCRSIIMKPDFDRLLALRYTNMRPPDGEVGKVHLVALEGRKYPPECAQASKVLSDVSKTNAYYPTLIVTRICESVTASGGVFSIQFLGNLPFIELERGKRYRTIFFSRVDDLSIPRSERMSASDNVYVEITANINIQVEGTDHKSPLVSVSCHGRWRNFFSKPDRIETVFRTQTEALSNAQTDACEATIINTLKSRPSLVTDGPTE